MYKRASHRPKMNSYRSMPGNQHGKKASLLANGSRHIHEYTLVYIHMQQNTSINNNTYLYTLIHISMH